MVNPIPSILEGDRGVVIIVFVSLGLFIFMWLAFVKSSNLDRVYWPSSSGLPWIILTERAKNPVLFWFGWGINIVFLAVFAMIVIFGIAGFLLKR